jgi:hypothetical protein
MKNIKRTQIRLLFIAAIFAPFCTIAIAQTPLLSDTSRGFDRNAPPVFSSRILRVPDSSQRKALEILGKNEFLLLEKDLLTQLFPARTFDTKQMLVEQAAAATAYAKKREDEAAIPFFASSKDWMTAEAEAHRDLARYTLSLPSLLFPYLVKSKVYFEGTGGFFIALKGNTLIVNHGSLGRTAPPLRELAIVVFLEKKITAVSVSAGMAE